MQVWLALALALALALLFLLGGCLFSCEKSDRGVDKGGGFGDAFFEGEGVPQLPGLRLKKLNKVVLWTIGKGLENLPFIPRRGVDDMIFNSRLCVCYFYLLTFTIRFK
mmetsp:Transcript_64112/g.75111  ORF Transcript_64112/g.75111 Transcript_64112/m.75111 type:complete len:108 (-) Transcript_64112:175-498(-)